MVLFALYRSHTNEHLEKLDSFQIVYMRKIESFKYTVTLPISSLSRDHSDKKTTAIQYRKNDTAF